MSGNYSYNLAAKLKKLKKIVEAHFLAGNSVGVVSNLTGLSPDLLQEWHDEVVLNAIKSGAARRILLREMLLQHTPGMLLKLKTLAQNRGDEKMQYSVANAWVNFAARFMSEDARITAAESRARKDTDQDAMLARSLFDIRDPDINGSSPSGAEDPEERLAASLSGEGGGLSEARLAEIAAAIDRLEKKLPDDEVTERTAEPSQTKEQPEDYYRAEGEVHRKKETVEFFDGLSEDLG